MRYINNEGEDAEDVETTRNDIAGAARGSSEAMIAPPPVAITKGTTSRDDGPGMKASCKVALGNEVKAEYDRRISGAFDRP